jgi:hypothetical protein
MQNAAAGVMIAVELIFTNSWQSEHEIMQNGHNWFCIPFHACLLASILELCSLCTFTAEADVKKVIIGQENSCSLFIPVMPCRRLCFIQKPQYIIVQVLVLACFIFVNRSLHVSDAGFNAVK